MRCAFLFCTVWLLPASVSAAPPSVDYLFPAGGQRGKTVEVAVSGTFDRWPVGVWVSGKGVEAQCGKQRGILAVTIAADAVPGTCWIRLHDEQGASAPRPFIVGLLPEILEVEPNDDLKKPQVIDSPNVTVNGRLGKDGDVDVYAVDLHKGQTLVASLEAHRTLRSPMDAILQVLSADGLVEMQDDDYHGLDPQIAFTAPKDGRYLVRLFAFPSDPTAAIKFAGGDKFIYRLTLTTAGFIDHAYPLAVSRDAPGHVDLIGWNLPKAPPRLTFAVDQDAGLATVYHADFANVARVRLEPHAITVKSKTNRRETPQAITLPVTITGRLGKVGDVDAYEFAAKRGQKLSFAVEARALDFRLDPVLKLTDAAGKVLSQVQAKALNSDVALDFTAPQDGNFRIEVHDFHGDGGLRYVYRLRAVLAEPDFALKVAGDRFALAPGKTLDIPVTVDRRNGFAAEVEVSAVGLPKGVTAQAQTGGKTVTLRLSGAGEPVSGNFRIVGTVKEQPDLKRIADAPLAEYGVSTMDLWLTMGPSATAPKDVPKKKKG